MSSASTRSGRRYPFIQTHDLLGALYDSSDGDIDPAQLTQALAKGARDMGARIVRFSPAISVRRDNGEWVVDTVGVEIRCEIIVNAAGYRAAEVGRMFGRDVPMMVMSHQYMLFEEIPELAAWSTKRWETAAASGCRYVLVSPAGEERDKSRPLREELPRPLVLRQRPDAGGFFVPTFSGRSGAAEWISTMQSNACPSSAPPACPGSSTDRYPIRPTAIR